MIYASFSTNYGVVILFLNTTKRVNLIKPRTNLKRKKGRRVGHWVWVC